MTTRLQKIEKELAKHARTFTRMTDADVAARGVRARSPRNNPMTWERTKSPIVRSQNFVRQPVRVRRSTRSIDPVPNRRSNRRSDYIEPRRMRSPSRITTGRRLSRDKDSTNPFHQFKNRVPPPQFQYSTLPPSQVLVRSPRRRDPRQSPVNRPFTREVHAEINAIYDRTQERMMNQMGRLSLHVQKLKDSPLPDGPPPLLLLDPPLPAPGTRTSNGNQWLRPPEVGEEDVLRLRHLHNMNKLDIPIGVDDTNAEMDIAIKTVQKTRLDAENARNMRLAGRRLQIEADNKRLRKRLRDTASKIRPKMKKKKKNDRLVKAIAKIVQTQNQVDVPEVWVLKKNKKEGDSMKRYTVVERWKEPSGEAMVGYTTSPSPTIRRVSMTKFEKTFKRESPPGVGAGSGDPGNPAAETKLEFSTTNKKALKVKCGEVVKDPDTGKWYAVTGGKGKDLCMKYGISWVWSSKR
jgi:hypothetical protein